MYFIDTQRTLTRRDSSLITPRNLPDGTEYSAFSPAAPPPSSSVPLTSESGTSDVKTPKRSVQQELVTMMFESMLSCIVESWDVIEPPKLEQAIPSPFEKTPSELTFVSRRRKSIVGKSHKPIVRRSRIDSVDTSQIEPIQKIWWSSPDQRAIVRFRNGNVYEGCISMKCMHGQGRFQWADGTVYLGRFENNAITGKGMIQWKDDSWYEGDFVGNVRHGKGLYVDSRKQRSYAGGWHCGTKHGQGVMYYNESFKNSYDGEWEYKQIDEHIKSATELVELCNYNADRYDSLVNNQLIVEPSVLHNIDSDNVRHGYGSREYSQGSGYKGDWDQSVREGSGLMIWPNHDFYSGEWKNGVMSGYGIYIWDAYYNNSLSLPSICAYRGKWSKGQRNGYGVLNLGFGMGSYYKGEFKNNKKHGIGRFVSNNGLILQNKNLFVDDNFGSMKTEEDDVYHPQDKQMVSGEPYKFDICDSTIGYMYHVQEAIKNIDKQVKVRTNIINDYIENNKSLDADLLMALRNGDRVAEVGTSINFDDLIDFEESSLRKSLRCYETNLKNIYYKYATVCNTEEIQFTPVLIRLFLWQFYYDCNMHEKGLTLVDIDKMFHRNPEWLSKSTHNPFEKIYFWQFLHSLISVASNLYAKRELPGPKPDTILASGFRTFMEIDILPNIGRRKGRLVDVYGQFVPLKGLYALYRSIGEPHTVRDFLCAVRRPPHDTEKPQPPILDAPDDCLPLGRNAYVTGDDVIFVAETDACCAENYKNLSEEPPEDLRLFNFGNLSSKAFIACAEESIRVKDEEMRWREKFSLLNCPAVFNSHHPNKSK